MCAQNLDGIELKNIADNHLRLYSKISEKREKLERSYLKDSIEVFEEAIGINMDFLSRISIKLDEIKNNLTTEKISEAIEVKEKIGSGQSIRYEWLLKSHVRWPKFYSSYEIIQTNHLRDSERSSLQRYYAGKVNDRSVNQRGDRSISKILKTSVVYDGKKPKNYYEPTGFLASLAEIISFIRYAFQLFLINEKCLSGNRKKIMTLIPELKKLEIEDKNFSHHAVEKLMSFEDDTNDKRIKSIIKNMIKNLESKTIYVAPELEAQLDITQMQRITDKHNEFSKLNETCDKFDIVDMFRNLNEEFLEIALSFYNALLTLIGALKRDIAMLDSCLFLMEFMKAKFQNRQDNRFNSVVKNMESSNLDSDWEYDGIEPFLELKKKEDMKLNKGIIDKELYDIRVKWIRGIIGKHIQKKYSLHL